MNRIIEIKDFQNPELDVYARLSEVQLLRACEPKPGLFIAESPRVIERAIQAGYYPVSFLAEKKELKGPAGELTEKFPDIPVYTAPQEILTQLTGFALTRGMLCAMKRKELLSPEAICADAQRIVILEDVVNPTNVGAIFRSAAALNMDAVLLTAGCSDPCTGELPESVWELCFRFPGPDLEKRTGRKRGWAV